MKKTTRLIFTALFIWILLSIVGCGGGGTSSSSGGGATQGATITGQVAGTVIVAVDQNGNEVDRDTASGNPKIFTINVPIGGSYRIYLIENDGMSNMMTYPVYYGSSNVLTINVIATINLGLLTVDTSSNVAIPANNPFTQGALDGGEHVSSPPALFLPGKWGISRVAPYAPWDGSWWCDRGYATINTSGTNTYSYSGSLERYGSASLVSLSANLSIGSTGYLNAGSNFEAASWMGVIDSGRTVVVAMENIITPGRGIPEMEIWLKKPLSYSLADLAGVWEYNALDPNTAWVIGNSGVYIGWWGRGTITIDSSGSLSGVINGEDNSATLMSKTLSITSDNVITDTLDPSMKCFLDAGKTIIACTNVDTDLVHGPLDFSILLKKASSYSLSDLTGTWQYSELDSELWWQRGPMTFNSNGSFLYYPM